MLSVLVCDGCCGEFYELDGGCVFGVGGCGREWLR